MIDVRFAVGGGADPSRPDLPHLDDPRYPDFERLGGEPGVRAIVDDFLDRIFADEMIGFLFDKAPKPRIRAFEYRWAAAHLGGPVVYDGRPLEEAHRAARLFDGHFARRLHLVRTVLGERGVPADIAARWLAHDEAQRERVLVGSCR